MSTRLKVILSALKIFTENKNCDIEMIRQKLENVNLVMYVLRPSWNLLYNQALSESEAPVILVPVQIPLLGTFLIWAVFD